MKKSSESFIIMLLLSIYGEQVDSILIDGMIIIWGGFFFYYLYKEIKKIIKSELS